MDNTKVLTYRQKYYLLNRDKFLSKSNENKDTRNAKRRENYKKNRDHFIMKRQQYVNDHREEVNKKRLERYYRNIEKESAYNIQYKRRVRSEKKSEANI